MNVNTVQDVGCLALSIKWACLPAFSPASSPTLFSSSILQLYQPQCLAPPSFSLGPASLPHPGTLALHITSVSIPKTSMVVFVNRAGTVLGLAVQPMMLSPKPSPTLLSPFSTITRGDLFVSLYLFIVPTEDFFSSRSASITSRQRMLFKRSPRITARDGSPVPLTLATSRRLPCLA